MIHNGFVGEVPLGIQFPNVDTQGTKSLSYQGVLKISNLTNIGVSLVGNALTEAHDGIFTSNGLLHGLGLRDSGFQFPQTTQLLKFIACGHECYSSNQ